jgi:undecaprenyl pyrophosphate synthase
METLLPELYALIYDELSIKSAFNLALSTPAAMRAFMKYSRRWHRDTIMDIVRSDYKAIASLSKIELLLACGKHACVLQEILILSSYVTFRELWKRHDAEVTMSMLGSIIGMVYEVNLLIDSAKRLGWDMQAMFNHALMRANAQACRRIMQNAEITLSSSDVTTAVEIACRQNDDELLQMLIAHDTNINWRSDLLSEAIGRRSKCIVKILLNYITPTEYSMQKAVKLHEYEIFQMLLDDGRVDPTHANNLILYKLTKRGDVDQVKRLLASKRVDPTIGLDAHRVALKRGYNDIAYLIDAHIAQMP